MQTIVGVLSSLVGCKVLRFRKDEVLLIGNSISGRDCGDLIEACSDVLGKLEGHRRFPPLNFASFHSAGFVKIGILHFTIAYSWSLIVYG